MRTQIGVAQECDTRQAGYYAGVCWGVGGGAGGGRGLLGSLGGITAACAERCRTGDGLVEIGVARGVREGLCMKGGWRGEAR